MQPEWKKRGVLSEFKKKPTVKQLKKQNWNL